MREPRPDNLPAPGPPVHFLLVPEGTAKAPRNVRVYCAVGRVLRFRLPDGSRLEIHVDACHDGQVQLLLAVAEPLAIVEL